MNSLNKIGFFIILLGIGYIAGNKIPIKIFKPNYTEVTLNKSEYFTIILSMLSTIITFCAILIALFKEDLRAMWKRPIVIFSTPDEMTVEDLKASLESEIQNDTPFANKYISRIEVKYNGNLPLLGAEIYLDKLEFTPKDSSIAQIIECSGSALKWNGTENQSIIIPPGGKKLIKIVEIYQPERFSTPESEKIDKPPLLKIGEIENTKEKANGRWTATFCCYAQNHKSTDLTVEIEWNGTWTKRLAEFKKFYKITKSA